MYDYTGIIRDVVQPGVIDDVFVAPLEELYSLGTVDRTPIGGDKIQKDVKSSRTSAAREFDRSDVNPTGGSNAFIRPYWTKRYWEVPVEIHELDLQEAEGRGEEGLIKLLTDGVSDALSDLKGVIFTYCMTQMKADLLNSGTYSDAALTRTTINTAYNDIDNATITLDDMNDAHFGVRYNKKKASGYQWLIEMTTFETVYELLAALISISAAPTGAPAAGGKPPIVSYKQAPLYEMDNMTIGDIYYFPKNALVFNEHMPMTLRQVDPGKFALKWIYRIGINVHFEHVLQCALLTNKDAL